MKNFIELTDSNGRTISINVNTIIAVIDQKDKGSQIHAGSVGLRTDTNYSEVLKMIAEAIK